MKKSLRTKLIVTGVLTILGFWTISGVLARRHAESYFEEQEIQRPMRQEAQSLLRELAGIRLLAAMGGVLTLSVVLGLIWRKRVSRPMALLSDQMRHMRLGTWSQPIPVHQNDEMGRLLREFNILGPELSLTAHQYAAASKLSAMALIGGRVVRPAMAARQQLLALSEALSRETVLEQVRQVAASLETIAADFDSEFQAELARVGNRAA
jgi:methyl-accepting chemotaxis protein